MVITTMQLVYVKTMFDHLADQDYRHTGGLPYFLAVHGIPCITAWTHYETAHLSGMLEEVVTWGGDLPTVHHIFVDSSTFEDARRRYALWLVSVYKGQFSDEKRPSSVKEINDFA